MNENNKNDLNTMPEEMKNATHEGTDAEQPEQGAGSDILLARCSELEKVVEQLKDQLLRKAAEFENYKKRNEAEYGDRIRTANEDLLTALLPVIDDFERSLKMSADRTEFEGFYRGIELIYQKFLRILESQGMKHYEVVGKPFDAYYHDALLQIARTDVPPHTILEEVEKGYMLNDRVLRHAKVIVSGEPTEEQSAADDVKNNEEVPEE
jgi:molecular chaperone GrpE